MLLISEGLEQVGCHFVTHMAIVVVQDSDLWLSCEIDGFCEAVYLALRQRVVVQDEDSVEDLLHDG